MYKQQLEGKIFDTSTLAERLSLFISGLGITIYSFEKVIGVSKGSIMTPIKNNRTIGSDSIGKIFDKYPDLNLEWLIAGKGEMIKRSEKHKENSSTGDFTGVMYGGKLEPVNPKPIKETEMDMSEKEIIEMQKGYIEALKFKVDALTKENQALSEEIRTWRTQNEAVKNI
ncbi:hypothetical protein [Dyadobacter sp. OTU695]|uniref:hypothetical protein n=1 Tax=Dyadobacter sp. OTU695 TaxID=3043860 RepID=UPI00313AC838